VGISSQSAREENKGRYGSTKWEAEKLIRGSNTDYTVVRPSFIYGPGERGLFKKLVNLLVRMPVVPVIGSGEQITRPIYVYDVVRAVMECLRSSVAHSKVYDLGGEANISFNEFLRAVLNSLGMKKRLVHIPVSAAGAMAVIMEKMLKSPPITRDNVIGIVQSAPVDNELAKRELGFEPTPLREGLGRSLKR